MRLVDQPLEGTTVAIPESRYGEEFARLFERAGARVRLCPLMTEQILEDRSRTRTFIEKTISLQFDVVIFMTGIGTELIFQEADAIGQRQPFLAALSAMTVVSRGSKSTAALKREQVRIDLMPKSATSEGLLEMFQPLHISARRIAIQLYGTANPQFSSALESMGARVFPVSVYAYEPASSVGEIEALVHDIIAGKIQIIAFTSAPQVVSLFDVAHTLGLSEALSAVLREQVRVASIGDVTTRALASRGVRPHIVPDQPRMGAMVQAICTTRSS